MLEQEYLEGIDVTAYDENPLKDSDCYNVRIANGVDYERMKTELSQFEGVRLVNDYQDKEKTSE